jgi:hypothetical protein
VLEEEEPITAFKLEIQKSDSRDEPPLFTPAKLDLDRDFNMMEETGEFIGFG